MSEFDALSIQVMLCAGNVQFLARLDNGIALRLEGGTVHPGMIRVAETRGISEGI